MSNIVLKIEQLEKSYDKSPFKLGPIDVALEMGSSLALIGQNGAGKTTFFQIITGNLDPTSGSVTVFGERMTPDRFELKRRIGYLAQHMGLPKWITGEEILRYACKLYDLPDAKARIDQSLQFWDCLEFRQKPLGSCSHGMKKRVALALSSIHNPNLLILDEPFSGLDLFHIKALKTLIAERQSTKKTTIICTHIAPYAAELCNDARMLINGQMRLLDDWQHKDQLSRARYMEEAFLEGTGRL